MALVAEQQSRSSTKARVGSSVRYEVSIIGAGLSACTSSTGCARSASVQVFEAGDGVGGTWYWNRYPGARFDSESWTYGYSFSDELLQEWDWSEHFSAQPETLRYCNHVADKFDLRRDIAFNCRVSVGGIRRGANEWEIDIRGRPAGRARFLDHRDRSAVGAHHADHPGRRRLSRRSLPHRHAGRTSR